MVNDLPTLKIGCGKIIGYRKKKDFSQTLYCIPEDLCLVCQHNLDAVKAHAAAHQKEVEKLMELREGVFDNYQRGFFMKKAERRKAARDAVLKIAGLAEKDLEAVK